MRFRQFESTEAPIEIRGDLRLLTRASAAQVPRTLEERPWWLPSS